MLVDCRDSLQTPGRGKPKPGQVLPLHTMQPFSRQLPREAGSQTDRPLSNHPLKLDRILSPLLCPSPKSQHLHQKQLLARQPRKSHAQALSASRLLRRLPLRMKRSRLSRLPMIPFSSSRLPQATGRQPKQSRSDPRKVGRDCPSVDQRHRAIQAIRGHRAGVSCRLQQYLRRPSQPVGQGRLLSRAFLRRQRQELETL